MESHDRERHLDEAAETLIRVIRQLGVTHEELARRMGSDGVTVQRFFDWAPHQSRAFSPVTPNSRS
jgi:hypothetical protein